MDLEAPIDAWYVWLGVAIASMAIAGVALSLPSEPPPDATKTANTVDEVASSSYNGSASYEHDANMVKLDARRIQLRNDGGTSRARVVFGRMIPVREHPENGTRGLSLLRGKPVTEVFSDPAALEVWAERVRDTMAESGGEWRPASGTVRVRRVVWGNVSVVLVDV